METVLFQGRGVSRIPQSVACLEVLSQDDNSSAGVVIVWVVRM